MGYKYLKLSQSRPQGCGTYYSLFSEHSTPDVHPTHFIILYHLCLVFAQISPTQEGLYNHCLKSFDHSHSYLITPYPFFCFYFSIALIFFLHVMYFTCLSYSFSLSHTPAPVSLEYKFSGEQRFVGLYFL